MSTEFPGDFDQYVTSEPSTCTFQFDSFCDDDHHHHIERFNE